MRNLQNEAETKWKRYLQIHRLLQNPRTILALTRATKEDRECFELHFDHGHIESLKILVTRILDRYVDTVRVTLLRQKAKAHGLEQQHESFLRKMLSNEFQRPPETSQRD